MKSPTWWGSMVGLSPTMTGYDAGLTPRWVASHVTLGPVSSIPVEGGVSVTRDTEHKVEGGVAEMSRGMDQIEASANLS